MLIMLHHDPAEFSEGSVPPGVARPKELLARLGYSTISEMMRGKKAPADVFSEVDVVVARPICTADSACIVKRDLPIVATNPGQRT